MKSSPILGHPPNSFLTRGRGFQSSPIGRVNRGVGNTAMNKPEQRTMNELYDRRLDDDWGGTPLNNPLQGLS